MYYMTGSRYQLKYIKGLVSGSVDEEEDVRPDSTKAVANPETLFTCLSCTARIKKWSQGSTSSLPFSLRFDFAFRYLSVALLSLFTLESHPVALSAMRENGN